QVVAAPPLLRLLEKAAPTTVSPSNSDSVVPPKCHCGLALAVALAMALSARIASTADNRIVLRDRMSWSHSLAFCGAPASMYPRQEPRPDPTPRFGLRPPPQSPHTTTTDRCSPN